AHHFAFNEPTTSSPTSWHSSSAILFCCVLGRGFVPVCASLSHLLAPALRILPIFAAFCRPKTLVCFFFFRRRMIIGSPANRRGPGERLQLLQPSPRRSYATASSRCPCHVYLWHVRSSGLANRTC